MLNHPEDACEYLGKAIELQEVFREQARDDRNFDNIRDNECFKN